MRVDMFIINSGNDTILDQVFGIFSAVNFPDALKRGVSKGELLEFDTGL